MSVGQLPVAVLSAAWYVSQPAASHCAASSLENHQQYLTLIQDGYQCINTSCSVLFLSWWQWWWWWWWWWWYMISVKYTMWNHGEVIWYKWENICFAMEKSAPSVISSVACCSSIDIHDIVSQCHDLSTLQYKCKIKFISHSMKSSSYLTITGCHFSPSIYCTNVSLPSDKQ